jgi:hypothetical protein
MSESRFGPAGSRAGRPDPVEAPASVPSVEAGGPMPEDSIPDDSVSSGEVEEDEAVAATSAPRWPDPLAAGVAVAVMAALLVCAAIVLIAAGNA